MAFEKLTKQVDSKEYWQATSSDLMHVRHTTVGMPRPMAPSIPLAGGFDLLVGRYLPSDCRREINRLRRCGQ
ncbi:hypothetical protein AOQ72_16270 [Bradyrhizobium yuanmingense]|uniref:Uncharacterized protein n=1 Tax=Bradyrhizobium yuanmingense TaxID=108015 RepID=A0A0R3CMA4_9BRAD|nr:hypothetical protein AOQ72_16270 [Bradyrhizobium yuanmingense]